MHLVIQTNAPAPHDPQGTQRRTAIFEANRQAAQDGMSGAVEKDQVILVLDLENCGLSKELANLLDPQHRERHAQIVQECSTAGTIPNLILRVPRWHLYKILHHAQRGLHRLDSRDPAVSDIVETLRLPAAPGTFYYLVISQGKLLASMPIRAAATPAFPPEARITGPLADQNPFWLCDGNQRISVWPGARITTSSPAIDARRRSSR